MTLRCTRKLLKALHASGTASAAPEDDSMHEQYLGDHEIFLASVIYSTTHYRWPHALANELFQAARSGARPGVNGIH